MEGWNGGLRPGLCRESYREMAGGVWEGVGGSPSGAAQGADGLTWRGDLAKSDQIALP